MEEGKEEFLKEFGEDYGYPNAPKNIDEIRASEFKRLDGQILSISYSTQFLSWNLSIKYWILLFSQLFFFGDFLGLVYLDHAGATLYSELQMEEVCKDFTTNVYGNPRILTNKKKKKIMIKFTF